METYVATVFPSKEQAISGHARLLQLAQQGAVKVERAGVYGRTAGGDLGLVDVEAPNPVFDLSALPGGAGQEVLDELDAALPGGAYALVAHLNEGDSSVVDQAMGACGGTVHRRPMNDLNGAAYQRFMNASKL